MRAGLTTWTPARYTATGTHAICQEVPWFCLWLLAWRRFGSILKRMVTLKISVGFELNIDLASMCREVVRVAAPSVKLYTAALSIIRTAVRAALPQESQLQVAVCSSTDRSQAVDALLHQQVGRHAGHTAQIRSMG